jgi:branched-chain amino acid transport system ATP-binding protein
MAMPCEAPILEVESISKRFDGVLAANNVSFQVYGKEIVGLIGPNGAGKTTTFNLISGRMAPSSGEVRFLGTRISGMRPDRIAALGVARTFQGTRIFPKLTVQENIETALIARAELGFWSDWFGLPSARRLHAGLRERANEILAFVGLDTLSGQVGGSLAYAHQSLLGIGLALAHEPRLLLFDEPFAGMNPRETANAAAMVQRIRDMGITVLLVEHDMHAVMEICGRIVVLDQGEKIAEGAPEEISSNQRVIEAYLGTDDDAQG